MGPAYPQPTTQVTRSPFVPKHSVSLRGELTFKAPNNEGKISVGGDYTYRSSTQLDAGNDYSKFIIDKTVLEWFDQFARVMGHSK